MVDHVVLFRLKSDAPVEKKNELMRSLVALKEHISGIVEASAGENFSARSHGYTHGFLARFSDRAALDAYISHPAHVAVVEAQVKPLAESVLVVDYNCSR